MLDESKAVPFTFLKGVDTISDETALPRGPNGEHITARAAVNVDISRAGKVRLRRGRTDRLAVTNGHSLWTPDNRRMYGVTGGNLVEFNPTRPPTIRQTLAAIESDQELCYAEVAGSIYAANEDLILRIRPDGTVGPVWPPTPEYQPTPTVGNSGDKVGLPPGQYLIALTYTERATGMESGATEVMVAEFAPTQDVVSASSNTSRPTGSIALAGLPRLEGHDINIYCTPPGGETLHRQATITYASGTTSYTILRATTEGRKLEHLTLADPMPPGQAIATYKGRLFVAAQDTVWYSFPGSYGLTRIHENFLPFGERVTLLTATEDGVFVGTSRGTYFISELESGVPMFNTTHHSAPVEGTSIYIPASLVGQNDDAMPRTGMLPYWFSDRGPMVGLPGGKVLPLTEDSVAHKAYGRGASYFRQDAGISAVVTALSDPGAMNRIGVGDRVSTQVIRAGSG